LHSNRSHSSALHTLLFRNGSAFNGRGVQGWLGSLIRFPGYSAPGYCEFAVLCAQSGAMRVALSWFLAWVSLRVGRIGGDIAAAMQLGLVDCVERAGLR